MVDYSSDGEKVTVCPFELMSSSRKKTGPLAYRNQKHLVLLFLHDAQCGFCQKVLLIIAKNYSEIQKSDAEVFGIIGGERQASSRLHSKLKIPFPFLYDTHDHVATECLTDIGRTIDQLVSKFKYDRLREDVNQVQSTLVFKKISIQSNDGQWFLMHIIPYRAADNVIDGVVITFTDISELKKLELALKEADERCRRLEKK